MNKSKLGIIIFVVILIILFLFGSLLMIMPFAIFDNTAKQNVYSQITGEFYPDQNRAWHDPENYFDADGIASLRVTSSTAQLGDYYIEQEKKDYYDVVTIETVPKTESTYYNDYLEISYSSNPESKCDDTCHYNGYDGHYKYESSPPDWIRCYCYDERTIPGEYEDVENVQRVYGCFGKYRVLKNGIQVKKYDWSDNTIYYEDDGFNAAFNQENVYWKNGAYSEVNWLCKRITSNYYYNVPEGSIKVEILPIPSEANKILTIKLKITNEWREINGDISLLLEVPTIIGKDSVIRSKQVSIKKGVNTYEFEESFDGEDILYVTPEILFYDDPSNYFGVNANCNGKVKDVKNCDQINLDIFYGDRHRIIISEDNAEVVEDRCGIFCKFWSFIRSLFSWR